LKSLTLSNSSQEILTQALQEMKDELGDKFSLDTVNLAELERRTHISRSKLRRLKKNGFEILPHGNKGKKKAGTVLTGFTGVIDDYLSKGVTNSEVLFERLIEIGYTGSISSIKRYISSHSDLIPAPRQVVSPQGNRGRRYQTGPGESYQMDWGFVNVVTGPGNEYQCACFAMICHHCGMRYIEFFPNARQESLFIGMIHAFIYMGVPKTVLTDNMKSVVIGRDSEGRPIWQKDYEAFMKAIGFETKLCKPRHPFTKGAVERLVRFVKDNFIVGRTFGNITDLNIEALKWCNIQNGKYHKAVDCIPCEVHTRECQSVAAIMTLTIETMKYLCPLRKISFDGFINYEGRRFGVPYSYTKKQCRVRREGFDLYIYDAEMERVLIRHNVTWSRKDSYCPDQFATVQPEEFPTAPVKSLLMQNIPEPPRIGFRKFAFGDKVDWND